MSVENTQDRDPLEEQVLRLLDEGLDLDQLRQRFPDRVTVVEQLVRGFERVDHSLCT